MQKRLILRAVSCTYHGRIKYVSDPIQLRLRLSSNRGSAFHHCLHGHRLNRCGIFVANFSSSDSNGDFCSACMSFCSFAGLVSALQSLLFRMRAGFARNRMKDQVKTELTSTGTANPGAACPSGDRKSTRLNSSHGYISYAVFCLKKKINKQKITSSEETRRLRIAQ